MNCKLELKAAAEPKDFDYDPSQDTGPEVSEIEGAKSVSSSSSSELWFKNSSSDSQSSSEESKEEMDLEEEARRYEEEEERKHIEENLSFQQIGDENEKHKEIGSDNAVENIDLIPRALSSSPHKFMKDR